MWELYGLWTWFLSLYTDYLEEQGENGLGGRTDELSRKRLASLVTFGAIGIGGFGCVFTGWLGEHEEGSVVRAQLYRASDGSVLSRSTAERYVPQGIPEVCLERIFARCGSLSTYRSRIG